MNYTIDTAFSEELLMKAIMKKVHGIEALKGLTRTQLVYALFQWGLINAFKDLYGEEDEE